MFRGTNDPKSIMFFRQLARESSITNIIAVPKVLALFSYIII